MRASVGNDTSGRQLIAPPDTWWMRNPLLLGVPAPASACWLAQSITRPRGFVTGHGPARSSPAHLIRALLRWIFILTLVRDGISLRARWSIGKTGYGQLVRNFPRRRPAIRDT
jgi:hypothetical protein